MKKGNNPLYVSVLWHMHQPYYKDPFTGHYRLPWVRLHGLKDYYDTAAILKDFPAIHQTFNLVPSLLKQLIDYTDNNASDEYLEVSRVPAYELTEAQKVFLLSNFFSANHDNMIKPLRRYHELFLKRGEAAAKEDIRKAVRYFSAQDYLDLQVFFNLCWFDPIFAEMEPLIKELIQKGGDYTEDEKKELLNKQTGILSLIIPEYKSMKEAGQIDITTTPFYHPILPLLYDTNSARRAMPGVNMPHHTFSHPEDVMRQVRMAFEYHESLFGSKPSGMWPSEGSVSQEIIEIIKGEGIKWIATDEGILERSLNIPLHEKGGREALYKPYTLNNGLKIVFRDRILSDLIGFVYYRRDARSAVNDFIDRLYKIKTSVHGDGPSLVSIILDGENPWEYYRNDGRDFLLYLYERLSEEEGIRCVTFSEYMDKFGSESKIEHLYSGSWINSNFGVWIGHDEDNLAWDLLAETRDALSEYSKVNPNADLDEAWDAIYAAEGSDWCWWYGDDHTTETPEVFDELFRHNLMNVYKIIGKEIPARLYLPVLKEHIKIQPPIQVRGFITPEIDGEVSGYYEWMHAACMEADFKGGAMHRAEGLITRLFYGFDMDNLYLRLDAGLPLIQIGGDISFSFQFIRPVQIKVEITSAGVAADLLKKVESEWHFVRSINTVAINDILEIAIPFADLYASEGDEIAFFLSVIRGKDISEKWPPRGFIALEVPGESFEDIMWQ
jgi:alpha-amylase/alpha-mannosidase (GH57 family)